jgi:hypothetical protein
VIEDDNAPELDEAFLRALVAEECEPTAQDGAGFARALGYFADDDELSKKELDRRREVLRSMKWTPVSSAFEDNVGAFPGLVEEEAHPGQELR